MHKLNREFHHRKKIRFDPDFTIARKHHFKWFAQSSRALYGTGPDLECNLKIYQDLLVYTFITDHLPPGAKLLEVGGGESRVLEKLSKRYECWNLDRLEGVGYGPDYSPERPPYRLVRAYAGEFSPEVPDHYFDMVFSISALEHTPPGSPDLYAAIAADMDRVLIKGGFSLHCLDAVLSAGLERAYYDYIFYEGSLKGAGNIRRTDFSPVPENGIHAYCPDIAEFFRNLPHLVSPIPDLPPVPDPFIWTMPKNEYDTTWKKYVTKIEYERFGMPTSLNIIRQKPLEDDPSEKPGTDPLDAKP